MNVNTGGLDGRFAQFQGGGQAQQGGGFAGLGGNLGQNLQSLQSLQNNFSLQSQLQAAGR